MTETTITLNEVCVRCGGTGKTEGGKACLVCLGTGQRRQEVTLNDFVTRVQKMMKESSEKRD